MKRIITIVRNCAREGPGLLDHVIASRNLAAVEVHAFAGGAFPPLDGSAALIVLGGPSSANDETVVMNAERLFVAEAVHAGVPVLGICLGLQILVKALGGAVVRNKGKEVGFRDHRGKRNTIALTAEGKKDPLFAGIPPVVPVFQLHGEAVVPAPGMTLLAVGEHCVPQAVKIAKRAYGLQCHCEMTPSMLADWLREDSDLSLLPPDSVRTDFAEIRDEYDAIGRTLFENFFALAGV